MPRVLRIFNRCIIGGPIINASYLTKYLSPQFETLLLMGAKDEHEQSADHLINQLGISYMNLPHMIRSINPLNDWKAYQEVRRIIRDFRPHIVHTHAAKPGAIGRLAAAAEKVPVVVHTYHGHVFHSYFNPLKSKAFVQTERFLARKTSGIIAISNAQKRELVDDFKIADETKFEVIPLGLDLDKFTQGQEQKRSKFRNEFGLADDVVAIGIIGRMVPVKNHQLFIKAISYVLKHTSKKVMAFIIGDGETRSEIEKIARQSGIDFTSPARQLIFASWRSDIDVVNAGLDVIALTSFNEGTPVSLIEAQAANKPIVSTEVGGISDVVTENVTALLSKVNDEQRFFDNLLRVVEDDQLRRTLSGNGRERVMEKFSYQRLVRDTAELYNRLLAQKSQLHVVV